MLLGKKNTFKELIMVLAFKFIENDSLLVFKVM